VALDMTIFWVYIALSFIFGFFMIDILVLRCPFKVIGYSQYDDSPLFPEINLQDLQVPTQAFFDRFGRSLDIKHTWEKLTGDQLPGYCLSDKDWNNLPTSFPGIAFKLFDRRKCVKNRGLYIEIKASPAKLMLGHNVFGSSDFYDCCMTLICLFYRYYPQFSFYLDDTLWSLSRIDITYSYHAKTNDQAIFFVDKLKNVSGGHTQSRGGFTGTAYWGSVSSKIKRIAIYVKLPEVEHTMSKNKKDLDGGEFLNSFYTPELLEYLNGLVRFEVQLFKRFFHKRAGFNSFDSNLLYLFKDDFFNIRLQRSWWRLAMGDILHCLDGSDVSVISENDLILKQRLRDKYFTVCKDGRVSYRKADNAYLMYTLIKSNGWAVASKFGTNDNHVKRSAFYKYLKMITSCGLSKSDLQNMSGASKDHTLPLSSFVPDLKYCFIDSEGTMQFDDAVLLQIPPGFSLPPAEYVYTGFKGFKVAINKAVASGFKRFDAEGRVFIPPSWVFKR
jgi:II/X family phage/plasmid replication protein